MRDVTRKNCVKQYILESRYWEHCSPLSSLHTLELTGWHSVNSLHFPFCSDSQETQISVCTLSLTVKRIFMVWFCVQISLVFIPLYNLNFPFVLIPSFKKKSLLYSICYFFTRLPFFVKKWWHIKLNIQQSHFYVDIS